MYAGKPIIGLAGGIGSGKSFIARLFVEQGCRVIDSDAQVAAAYRQPAVLAQLLEWWGPAAIDAGGHVNRSFVAGKIFTDAIERKRLEHLLHPLVKTQREQEMKAAANDASVLAFVWDSPLLYETGLADECDCIVFVESGQATREQRVYDTRGWDSRELLRRENLQWPLDKKRRIADYLLSNTADAAPAREQVRDLFPRILAQVAAQSASGGRYA